jgi:23S rRNA (cytidine1920-2'-O)/16S rRNA (cytidine1409-2'-O)-methyltransferase
MIRASRTLPALARERLDKLLVDRGLVQSRERARALILAGKVLVAGQVADKAGLQVELAAEVRLREADHPFVSRGALKLVRALDHFVLDPAGRCALDVGASTGGFTDVLLRRGARKVIAIDVGYGQLDYRLRQDPRVVVRERENIRYTEVGSLDERPSLAVCDVSFISLGIVLPKMAELVARPAELVCLIKPQFEVGKGQVGKGGVVREPAARQAAVDKIVALAGSLGLGVRGVVESPITGPAGNVEYLIAMDASS